MADNAMKLVSEWCESVIDALRPQKVFIVGNGAEEITGCFAEKNISVSNTSWDSINGAGSTQAGAWDVVILDCTSADFPQALPETGFFERLGAPQTLLAVVPLAVSGPSLPEVSVWLRRYGYTHDFNEERWFSQQAYTATYRKSSVDSDQQLWQQEAALWRLLQINQKQRLLLSEYMGEVVESALQYGSQVSQLNVSNQNLEQELERQTEYSKSLQAELTRQEEWAKTLQNEIKQQQESTAQLQQELMRQEELARTLQNEVQRQEELARTLQNEVQRQEEWAKTLQNEVEQRTNAYNGLLEENRALQKERAEWEAFQASKFGKLWKQFHRSGG